MAYLPETFGSAVIRSDIEETSVITVGPNNKVNCAGSYVLTLDNNHPAWTCKLDPQPPQISRVDLSKTEDCYYLVFKTLLDQATPEKMEEYRTLLKINQNNYRLTVLQIETGENNDNRYSLECI